MSAPFDRGLSDKLLEDLLHGPCSTVLQAGLQAGLDVRLRNDYLNLYLRGRSLARLEGRRRGPAKLEVHHKYLDSDRIGDTVGRRGKYYCAFDVDNDFAEAYADALDAVITRAFEYMGREEGVELQLLRSNGLAAAVCCFDRQIQVPGIPRRLDLMGLRAGPPPTLAAIEVKRYPDQSIQYVPKQLHQYLEIFDPEGSGLRADVASSYRKVCEQLHSLGLPAPEPSQITSGMPVEGLVVVSDYKTGSDLLPRAHRLAQQLERLIHLWQPMGEDLRIPDRSFWIRMGDD